MIRKITGSLVDIGINYLILDVNGVGYHIYVSKSPAQSSLLQTYSLWTHLAVRETALDLYGFSTRDELEIFELLLTLPKIGPKSALQIMSQADIELIKKAVFDSDATYLSKMSGMSKKTAEKIVLGLKEKLDGYGIMSSGDTNSQNHQNIPYVSDTIDALVALGYPQSDARRVVQQLSPTITTANEAVREALKILSV